MGIVNWDIDVVAFLILLALIIADNVTMRVTVTQHRKEIDELKEGHKSFEDMMLEKLNNIETAVAFIKGKMSQD